MSAARTLTKNTLRSLAFIALAFLVTAGAGVCRAADFPNPLMPGADPHALTHGKTVWIYPTGGGGEGAERRAFYAFSSEDLIHWRRHGPVLRLRDVQWITGKLAWAPGVIERGGKWYFYYSLGPKPSSIGVAVGDNPAGPFRDSGKPLLQDKGEKGFEAIDAMVFADPQSGKCYLYAGGSAGATLRVFELNPDMVSFAREVRVKTPQNFTEGAFMHYRNELYYLSYSHGNWRKASYSVHYATSKTPVGPWTYRGAILVSDATRKGPGHHSFFTSPVDGADFIAYHRYDGVRGNGPYERVPRRIALERVHYDKDGMIRPIVMTDATAAEAGVGKRKK